MLRFPSLRKFLYLSRTANRDGKLMEGVKSSCRVNTFTRSLPTFQSSQRMLPRNGIISLLRLSDLPDEKIPILSRVKGISRSRMKFSYHRLTRVISSGSLFGVCCTPARWSAGASTGRGPPPAPTGTSAGR